MLLNAGGSAGNFSSSFFSFFSVPPGMGPRVLRCFCAVGLRFVRYLRGFGLKSVLLKRLLADCPFLANRWPRILYVFLSFLIEIALNHCPVRIARYLRGF